MAGALCGAAAHTTRTRVTGKSGVARANCRAPVSVCNFVRGCVTNVWPSSSTRRRGMCKSKYGPAVPVRAARRAMGGPALIMFFLYAYAEARTDMIVSDSVTANKYDVQNYVPTGSAPSRPRAPPVPSAALSAACVRVASSRPIPVRGSCSARTSPHDWTRWGWRAAVRACGAAQRLTVSVTKQSVNARQATRHSLIPCRPTTTHDPDRRPTSDIRTTGTWRARPIRPARSGRSILHIP